MIRKLSGLALLTASIWSPVSATEGSTCDVPTEEQAVLRADEIRRDASGVTRALGNVRIESSGAALETDEVRYRDAEDTFEMPGEFRLVFSGGETFHGDSARLSRNLEEGEITGVEAGYVDDPSRFRADRAVRVAGGGLRLDAAVFSPCPISPVNPVPLWRVRASRIDHDQERQDVVYRNPVFEVAGLPVAYLPLFRHPDPNVTRRSGFLVPSVDVGTTYGFGVRVPYYLAIAPDREALFSVFSTTADGPIVESKYRQLYSEGEMSMHASAAYNDVDTPMREERGSLFVNANWKPGATETLGGEIKLASHRGYVRRYGFSRDDHLRNRLYLESFHDDRSVEIDVVGFQTQRLEESSRRLAIATPDVSAQRRYPGKVLGGQLDFAVDARFLRRLEGRDSTTLGGEALWRLDGNLPGGVRHTIHASVRADAHSFSGQPAGGPSYTDVRRLLPQVGIDAVWPLVRLTNRGAHVIEPLAQWIWSPERVDEAAIPNEDSLDVEFDEFSLLSRNRFTGRDRVETGTRWAGGLRYNYLDRSGLRLDAVAGQVFRAEDLEDFTPISGLRGRSSDYVFAWGVSFESPARTRFSHRGRFTDELVFRRNDVTLDTTWGRLTATGGYLFLAADPDAPVNSPDRDVREEMQTELGIGLDPRWRAILNYQRDVHSGWAITSSFALQYDGTCLKMRIAAEREHQLSSAEESVTTLAVRVELLTFDSLSE